MVKELAILQVETTNICNAHCVFCQHDKFTEFGTMTDELYEKIITEASGLPRLHTFIPMLTGEPFCDKQIVDRVKYASEKLPWVNIQLYTNGSLLTIAILNELKKFPNFNLSISLNGLNPDTRKKVMGLHDWGHVIRMTHYAEQIKLPYRVTMVVCSEVPPEEVNDFIKSGGMALQYQSWAGQQYPYKRIRWTSCVRALNHMTIRYNGDANLCCFDPFSHVSFGNLNTQTIKEIWGSAKRQEYILRHKAGEGHRLELCDSCTEG